MEQNLEIKVTDGNIKVMCGDHEMASRKFEMTEWHKMMHSFKTSFDIPSPFSFTEIDWWVATDDQARGNWKRNFYKIIVNYKNGFQYKFRSWIEFNDVFGTSFSDSTTFEGFKKLIKKKNVNDCVVVQSEFDVS